MTEFWYFLLFAALAMLVTPLSGFVGTRGVRKDLARSFAEQTVGVDGEPLDASTLEVLYRSPTVRERYGCHASWICRAHGDAYLLALAQGELTQGRMIITWTWHRLTEQRARQGMMHDQKAYRAAFPDEAKA